MYYNLENFKHFKKLYNQIKKDPVYSSRIDTTTKQDRTFILIYLYLHCENINIIKDIDDFKNIIDNSCFCPCNTEYIASDTVKNYSDDYKKLYVKNYIKPLHYFNTRYNSILSIDNVMIPCDYIKQLKNYNDDKNRFLIKGAKWWDRVNGNTYNAAKITDTKTEKVYYIAYEYGYGNDYLYRALRYLKENKIINYEINYKNYIDITDYKNCYYKKSDVKNYNF